MSVLDDGHRAVLAEGRQLHVGVLSTTGPHVTPELYTYDRDEVWSLTAADTLKARVVRRDPRTAVAVRTGSRWLLLAGKTDEYDIVDAAHLAAAPEDVLRALAALTSFTVRNATDLAAFGRDLVAGRLPSRLPMRRTLMRLIPERAALFDGTALQSLGGTWPGTVTVPDDAPPLDGDVDCVVAAEAPDGLAVIPGRAAADLNEATLPAAALQIAGVSMPGEVAGAVVVDDYNSPGPAAKSGALLRGTLRLQADGAICRATIVTDRKTTWDGAHTRTASA